MLVHALSLPVPVSQDSGRLLDFDYSDEDIDSLRKQMVLPGQDPPSPASSLSDELGALGAHIAYPYASPHLTIAFSTFVTGKTFIIPGFVIPQ